MILCMVDDGALIVGRKGTGTQNRGWGLLVIYDFSGTNTTRFRNSIIIAYLLTGRGTAYNENHQSSVYISGF